MEIATVKELQAKLECEVAALVRHFEMQTGCLVEEPRFVRIAEIGNRLPVLAQVKLVVKL